MNLRIARKILSAIGTDREWMYSTGRVCAALRRTSRTRSCREDVAYLNGLVVEVPVSFRVKCAERIGWLGTAFDLLMRTPEEEWEDNQQKERLQ